MNKCFILVVFLALFYLLFFNCFRNSQASMLVNTVEDVNMLTTQGRYNIQTILNQLLIPSPNLKIDGKIGPKSREAVRRFQALKNLVPDGKIGIITRTALFNSYNNLILTTSSKSVVSGGINKKSSSSDKIKPVISSFAIPETSTSLTINIVNLTATDNESVTGYMLTESSSTPSKNSSKWTSIGPTTYTFTSSGSKTLYAWARDAAGNVSVSSNDFIQI